jgi:hypothetical protein
MALVNVGVEVNDGGAVAVAAVAVAVAVAAVAAAAAAAAAPPVREWLVTLAADEDLKWFHGSAYDFLPM